MSEVIGEAFVAIRPDVQNFSRETESGVKGALGSIAKTVGGLFIAQKVGQGLRDTLDAGSDLNETISKTQAVFKEAGPEALTFGDTAATALLESKQAALEQLSTLGNLFTSLGIGRGKALDMGKGMVSLAADLGSFNNVPTDEALEAIRSGLVGETEPLRRFGVNMNEATLKAKALELGISDGTATLTPAQKAQAAYALILDQTSNAQGDVAKTGGNAAGQQKTLNARMEDLQATVGQKLLPIFNKLLEVGIKIIDWLKEHKTVAIALAGVVGGALVAAFVAWAASMITAAGAALALAAPVLAIIAVIALVIAAAVLLWTKWDEVWNLIKEHPAIAIIVGILAAPIAAFVLIIGGLKLLYENWDSIWGAILGVLQSVWGVIEPILGFFVARFNDIIAVLGWLKGAFEVVFGGISSAVETAWGAISPIIDKIVEGVRTAVDAVNSISSFVTGSSGNIKDVSPEDRAVLKKLGYGATGGIVTRPTLSLLGEHGPEAVVPLNQMPGASALPGGFGGPINVYTSTPITDRSRFAVELHQRLALAASLSASLG